MKKLLFSFALALLVSVSTYAQLATFVLDDFENGLVNFTTEIHGNPPASFDYMVVDNPVKTGINTSNKAWEWDRFDTGDNQNWAGFWAALTNPIPKGYTSIEVKYMRTKATSQLRMKVEGAVTLEFNPVNPATKVNEWETLVFDLYGNNIKNINVISFFPDYYSPVDVTAKCYIDDIKIIYDPSVIVTIPTSLTLFGNSTDNRFYDTSWINQTAPSTVVAESWDGQPATSKDKFPVVTSPVKAGTNALKLDWTSATGGDWMGMVAGIGWTHFDLTTMTHLKLWINSPVVLAKSALPKIYLEAFSGSPNVTGKIQLGDYLTTDLAANTWTEVTIPLADLWAADPTFSVKSDIKDIFFSQNATDNVEHTLYLDEFRFVSIANLFHDSGDPRFYDTSWINQTAPSVVVAESWDGQPATTKDKFPVVSSPVKSGVNALKLDWTSATGGDWMGMVAGIGWPPFDLTNRTHLDFWINSPVVLAKSALPKVHLEATGGSPNVTGKVLLSNYLATDLAANTWTEVTIPLADLWAADPTFTGKDIIKDVFFSQNLTDNVEHILYLDEFNFTTVTSTGIFTPSINKSIQAYYSNGEIRIPSYNGNVRVLDLAGRTIVEGLANDGKLRVSIEKGIYIVNTTLGNTKLSIR